jgi:hypothetical protein
MGNISGLPLLRSWRRKMFFATEKDAGQEYDGMHVDGSDRAEVMLYESPSISLMPGKRSCVSLEIAGKNQD